MLNFSEVCLIVDAYSTGKHLAPAFKKEGISCIHLKSSTVLPEKFKHHESDFEESFVYDGNLEKTLMRLKSFSIRLCIAGYESGVELADTLSEQLNVPGNGTAYSIARRNKYVMTEVVAKAGLKTVKHIQAENSHEILQWIANGHDYPIVIKPLDSANGDGVFFCHSETDVIQATTTILSSLNQFGEKNIKVLAQTLNVGQEYIINTASHDGNHYIAEVWRIRRIPNTTIYDTAEFITEDEEEWDSITTYTKKVLDALHIRFGAGTTEIKYSSEHGSVLLETSSRLMGGAPVYFIEELAGQSQLSLTIESYLCPESFLKRFQEKRPSFQGVGMGVVLISDVEGTIYESFEPPLRSLKTLHTLAISQPGDKIEKTINSLTAPGELYLLDKTKNKKNIQNDYQSIRAMEKEGMYQHAVTKPSSSRLSSIGQAASVMLFKPDSSNNPKPSETILITQKKL